MRCCVVKQYRFSAECFDHAHVFSWEEIFSLYYYAYIFSKNLVGVFFKENMCRAVNGINKTLTCSVIQPICVPWFRIYMWHNIIWYDFAADHGKVAIR